MTRIFAFILLIWVVLSCSRDRKIAPDPPVEVKLTGLLKTVTIQSPSGETKEEYSYIDSLTLKSIRYTRDGQSTVETFEYERDTLRSSRAGDTLKKYVYRNGRLSWIEKHMTGKPEFYTIVIFNFYSDVKVSNIEKRENSANGLSSNYLSDLSIIWRGENISMFRERFSNGSVEDHDFRYGESRNPYTRLYTETLRIPAESPYALSYNNPLVYSTFFTGRQYRVEGEYLNNRLPLSETIFEFSMENGGEWKTIKQYTFEYYE